MPVSFHPYTHSNNNNVRPLQEEENQAERLNRERYGNNENNVNFGEVNPWSKGKFIEDPEGARLEAAESGDINETNEENRFAMEPGRYPKDFRAEVARRATLAESPVIVEGYEITEVVIGPDKKRYAKLCDKITGICILVALAGIGVAQALGMKGGKTRRRRHPRMHRTKKTRSN